MAVLLPEPESPVTTTRWRPSVIRSWGPVQCSGAARPAVQPPRGSRRAPQTPSASSTPLGVGLPLARSVSALALGLPSSFAPLLACHQGQERLLERDLDRGEREEAPAAPGDARRQLGARVPSGLDLDAAAHVAVRL